MPAQKTRALAIFTSVALGLSAASGCATFEKLRGEGLHDNLTQAGASMRPSKHEKRGWFLSRKADEIDSHFGD